MFQTATTKNVAGSGCGNLNGMQCTVVTEAILISEVTIIFLTFDREAKLFSDNPPSLSISQFVGVSK